MSLLKRKYLVSGGISKSFQFWDPVSGKWLETIDRAQDGYISCICKVGGDLLATTSDDTIILWKWKQRKRLYELAASSHSVSCLSTFPISSRKPKYLISGGDDCVIRKWNLDEKICEGRFISHTGAVTAIRGTIDGTLISSSQDSTVKIWNFEEEKLISTINCEKMGSTHSIDYDQSSKLLYIGTESGEVQIYNSSQSDKAIHNICGFRRANSSILSLGNQKFIFGDISGKLCFHDLRKPSTSVWKIKLHRDVVNDIITLRDGKLASCSRDSSIRIFNMDDGKVLRKMKERREILTLEILESSKKRKCPFGNSNNTLPFKRDLTRYRIGLDKAINYLNCPRFLVEDLVNDLKLVKEFVHSQSSKKALDDHCYYLVDCIYKEIHNVRNKLFILKDGRSVSIYFGDWEKIGRKKNQAASPDSDYRKSAGILNNSKELHELQANIRRRERVRRRSLSVGLPVEISKYAPLRSLKKKSEVFITGKGKIFAEGKRGVFTLIYDGRIRKNEKHRFGRSFKIAKSKSSSSHQNQNSLQKPDSLGIMHRSSPIQLSKKRKKKLLKKKELLNISIQVNYLGFFRRDLKSGLGVSSSSQKSNNFVKNIGIYQAGKFVEKLEDIFTKAEKNSNDLEKEFREFCKFKKMNKIYYNLTTLWESSFRKIMDSLPHFMEYGNKYRKNSISLDILDPKISKEEEIEGEGEENEDIKKKKKKQKDFKIQRSKSYEVIRSYDLEDEEKNWNIFNLPFPWKLFRKVERIGKKMKSLIQSFEKRMKLVKYGEFKYLGNWNNDTFNGEGSLYIRNSQKKKRLSLTKLMKKKYTLLYYGNFKNGNKHGVGRLYESDGKEIRYFGKFFEGKQHGQGIEYGTASSPNSKKNGKDTRIILREGEWKDGVFVGERKEAKVKEIDLGWFFKEILSDPDKNRDHFVGQGTFAQVYRIFISKYGWCAFKYFPHAARNSDQLGQISSEMNILSTLNHVNIIKIHACSMKEPVGIVQEFLHVSMNDFIDDLWKNNKSKKENSSSTESVNSTSSEEKLKLFRKKMNIILETCRGMEYLHSNHIMHRDLKWDNVMLDKQGSVRIIDFGFSKWIKSFMPQRNTYGKVGSPFYIAPEVLLGSTKGDYKYKCDVFSFGIMLYELIFETLDPYDLASKENYFGAIEYEVAKKNIRPLIPKDFSISELVGIDDADDEEGNISWLISLMKQCWDNNPLKRPSFTNILQIIHSKTYFL